MMSLGLVAGGEALRRRVSLTFGGLSRCSSSSPSSSSSSSSEEAEGLSAYPLSTGLELGAGLGLCLSAPRECLVMSLFRLSPHFSLILGFGFEEEVEE